MNKKEFDTAHSFKKFNELKCCLSCVHARRWSFESSYSEDPNDLTAMCLHEDAPNEIQQEGSYSRERKYVGPFGLCNGWKRDKEIK